jgi:phosphate uptake regulator
MFRDLIKIWKEQDFTNDVIGEFSSMLAHSQEMLQYALKVIVNRRKGKKSDQKIYFKDQKINLTEQEIRRRILIHLTTNPGGNLPAFLSLISLAKDAERLGDYVKNIFELNDIIGDCTASEELFNLLFVDIGNEVLELFSEVRNAFISSDHALAKKSTAKARAIADRCEKMIEDVVETDCPKRISVGLALGARYFKRIALHLSNIASSVFLPLPEMDYIDDAIDHDD